MTGKTTSVKKPIVKYDSATGLYACDENNNRLEWPPQQIMERHPALSMLALVLQDYIRHECDLKKRGEDIDVMIYQAENGCSVEVAARSDKSGKLNQGLVKSLEHIFAYIEKVGRDIGLQETEVRSEYFYIGTGKKHELLTLLHQLARRSDLAIGPMDDPTGLTYLGNYTFNEIEISINNENQKTLGKIFSPAALQKTAPDVAGPATIEIVAEVLAQTITAAIGEECFTYTFFPNGKEYIFSIRPKTAEEADIGRINNFFHSIKSIPRPRGVTCNPRDLIFRTKDPLTMADYINILTKELGLEDKLNDIMDAEELEAAREELPPPLWDRAVPRNAQSMLCEILVGLGRFQYSVTADTEWDCVTNDTVHVFTAIPSGRFDEERNNIADMLADMRDKGGAWEDLHIDEEELTISVKDLAMLCRFFDAYAEETETIFGTSFINNFEVTEDSQIPYAQYEQIIADDNSILNLLPNESYSSRKHLLLDIHKIMGMIDRNIFVSPYSTDDVYQQLGYRPSVKLGPQLSMS